MTVKLYFGKFLKMHRKKLKMSINQLSRKVYGNRHNVGRISEIEKGNINCEIETMEQLLNGVDLTLKDVFVSRQS